MRKTYPTIETTVQPCYTDIIMVSSKISIFGQYETSWVSMPRHCKENVVILAEVSSLAALKMQLVMKVS